MEKLDRSVVVTGAASGIGREVASTFAGEGARVALLDFDAHGLENCLEHLPDPSSVQLHPVDVNDPSACQAAIASIAGAWGPIDTLVHCAGVVELALLMQTSDQTWQRMVDVLLTGTLTWIEPSHGTCQQTAPDASSTSPQ